MAFAVEMLEYSIASVKRELERHDCSVPDRIRSLMRQWAKSWDEDPEFHALVAKQSRMMTEAKGVLRERSLQLYEQYERLFAEGQKRGEIRADHKPLHLAEMMEGMLILIAGNWVSGWWENRSDSLEERFMNAMTVFLEGCARRSPSGRKQSAERRLKTAPAKKSPSSFRDDVVAALPKRDAHVIIREPPQNGGPNTSGVQRK